MASIKSKHHTHKTLSMKGQALKMSRPKGTASSSTPGVENHGSERLLTQSSLKASKKRSGGQREKSTVVRPSGSRLGKEWMDTTLEQSGNDSLEETSRYLQIQGASSATEEASQMYSMDRWLAGEREPNPTQYIATLCSQEVSSSQEEGSGMCICGQVDHDTALGFSGSWVDMTSSRASWENYPLEIDLEKTS